MKYTSTALDDLAVNSFPGPTRDRQRRGCRSLLPWLMLVVLGGACVASDVTYQERWRPQFHFTPSTNWMNDPNGMVYYEGEYHLFYQYNPFGNRWGHMSWGHAVSTNLVHWEHLPVALQEENGIMIFSGSAVVDHQNTSGFGRGDMPPLVAIYTGHYTEQPLQNQHLAFSNDRGRTWTKYEGNPVLDIGERDFRDPKVMWHQPSQRWIMTIAWPVQRKVRFYASPNLKEWTHLSDFGPAGSTASIWECPDLFPLASKDDPARSKWVLIVNVGSGAPAGGSGCQYFVGEFDGQQFVLDADFPKPQPEHVPDGRVIADFEEGNLEDWTAAGDAFDNPLTQRAPKESEELVPYRGRRFVNSFATGDSATGTLTSPEFSISHNHLSFLIGGGHHVDQTCMNLIVDGATVRTATGHSADGQIWKSWDVSPWRGKSARLQLVDRHQGAWGHINVDYILLADDPVRPATQPALWADYGPDFYAAVSWSDVPAEDGRRLWLGWMSNWQYANDVPTHPWRSAMSAPRTLHLQETTEGWRLIQIPVEELLSLRRGHSMRFAGGETRAANVWIQDYVQLPALMDVEIQLSGLTQGSTWSWNWFAGPDEQMQLIVDAEQGLLILDRTRSGRTDFHSDFPNRFQAPIRVSQGRLSLRVICDTSSMEIFAGSGNPVLTTLLLPERAWQKWRFAETGAGIEIDRIEIHSLKSIWR